VNVSAWSIRNPVPPVLLFAILTLLGIVSFRALPITQFPNIDIPIVVVTVAQPGAAPSELVSQVTEPIEDAISGIQNIRHITSVASKALPRRRSSSSFRPTPTAPSTT
jgi:multidrug efflux pump subunit AcrB